MVSSSKELDPQKLSPTERAAHYHRLRAHLQVILWKKLMLAIESSAFGVGHLTQMALFCL